MTSDIIEPLRCVECGEQLLARITDEGVETIGGHRLTFRRRTDFVLCPSSSTLYRVTDLRMGIVSPVADEDLMPDDDPPGGADRRA